MARIVGRQNRDDKIIRTEYYECPKCGAVGKDAICEKCGAKATFHVSRKLK